MSGEFKIYTKTGDDGTTGLVGGSRVKKYDLRLESYGTVDELNACIGVIRSFEIGADVQELLLKIQNKLFNIGSRLASDEKGEEFTAQLIIKAEDIEMLEKAIDAYHEELPELRNFILPGGELSAAQCHMARTICRRAERRIVEFSEQTPVQPELIKFINRLSDYLFVLARKLSHDKGVDETNWEY
ncbi:cob(I)yrinic acid a,c-diamide adenosyltransferase [Draconibacterium sp. IB214405]|uniref:cob(I)yrinic acid a,c-diamide adenosyltransferase n=1 Tax=Draconibacterium sp. IB214405 TaxID=3097352 RepID=UPI002A13FEFA|nr:cob(I)yrinic acid a,c-diamide adenosyltransferase [Draconibacterium sp. IB214405]MDX8339721.1 cob(I)yrinic acid a,c-diamide adenosyltransferase [Draconibacterium sp. IB214405]